MRPPVLFASDVPRTPGDPIRREGRGPLRE